MTNEEIVAEIRELKNDMQDAHREQREEMRELKKEFYLFKNKAMFFMGSISVFIAIANDYIKKKLGL
jgi:4-diphosphocytidyl-2C-methyl-D-erythritol kinase